VEFFELQFRCAPSMGGSGENPLRASQ